MSFSELVTDSISSVVFELLIQNLQKQNKSGKDQQIFDENWYLWVFLVAYHESEVRFSKFKMADPIS